MTNPTYALVEVDITRGNLEPLPIAVSPLYIEPGSIDVKQGDKLIKNVGEVSININPKLRGLSLSGTLLKDSINSFISETSVSKLVANIDKKNKASIKIFNND